MKKTIITAVLVLCMVFLAGWGKKAVELLNDTPLIDLNKAIKESPIGNQGNTLTSEENESESDEKTADKQTESSSDKTSVLSKEEKKEPYRIKIRDMTISYRNEVCDTPDVLKDKLIRDCSNGEGSVYLEDDYAEAHVYREVLAVLEQLHETIGLEYRAE